MSIVTWFLTSRIGQGILAAGAVLLAVGAALLKVFSAGKSSEKSKQTQAVVEIAQKRKEINDEIDRLPDADVDRRLRKWSRD